LTSAGCSAEGAKEDDAEEEEDAEEDDIDAIGDDDGSVFALFAFSASPPSGRARLAPFITGTSASIV
jgi:hypothetical protein